MIVHPPLATTPAPETAPKSGTRSRSATRDKLIEAALSLFARYGIEAVSIRQITQTAGQSNESAVHYHFKNKAGLIGAVLEHVNAQLAPMQADTLQQLEVIARERPPSVREIVSHGVMPFVMLHAQSSNGRKAIRFLSHLTWQSNEGGLGLLIASLWPYYERLERLLAQALPQKSPSTLRLHGVLAISNVIHSLADTRLLGDASALNIADLLFQGNPQLLSHFIDYIVGGLCSDERSGSAATA